MFVFLTALIVASIAVLAFSFLSPSILLRTEDGPQMPAVKTLHVLERSNIFD